MHKSYMKNITIVLSLLCAMGATLLSTHVQAAQIGGIDPTIEQVTQQVLLNIRANGFNPNAKTKKIVTGGLYVNWKMDDPTHTNNVNPNTNDDPPSSHDIQTDLYYLTDLAEYKFLHPHDSSYDQDIQKILPIVHAEFFNYNLPKGWVYFYLLRDGTLLHDATLTAEANMAASNYYTNWYDQSKQILYNKSHNPGVYSVEHSITASAALMDAGMRNQNQNWFHAGLISLNTALYASYNAQAQLFYNNMTVNENGSEVVLNAQAKSSTQGSVVEALMDAYMYTHNHLYIDVADRVLQSMFGSSGLWDQNNGGLYFAYNLNSHTLEQKYKETRAQVHTLIGLYRYNQVLRLCGQPQKYLDKQQQLIQLLSTSFYRSDYHGYFYRVTPTFQTYVARDRHGNSVAEDYFTTEAMGLALDALQQTEMTSIPF